MHGTTGYDFLHTVNQLLVHDRGVMQLGEFYASVTGISGDWPTVLRRHKRKVTAELFNAETDRLTRQLEKLASADRWGRDLAPEALRAALIEVTASLGVYRTYIVGHPAGWRDRRHIASAMDRAEKNRPHLSDALSFLGRVLTLDFPPGLPTVKQQAWLTFVKNWQQFTGPVMAKGGEDTAFYVYNRLVSLNEVGGDPTGPGLSPGEFHRFNRGRLARWPHTMNATSTHDTKRSEDVRARINVLSEIPDLWAQAVAKRLVRGRPVPEDNMEYLFYQTLVGAWPLDPAQTPLFLKRLGAYLIKAAREAKRSTDWFDPDAAYERALQEFAATVLATGENNRFLPDFISFERITAAWGYINALAQVLLKIASPGVPDFYQGTELWDLSLVDPDNRRPVDFALRARLLDEMRQAPAALTGELLSSWRDGRIKLYLIQKALHFRLAHRDLFAGGDYLPVAVSGPVEEHVCAFARRRAGEWALVAVPLHPALLHRNDLTGPSFWPADPVWKGNMLYLSKDAPGRWWNIFTGELLDAGSDRVLPLIEVFAGFPVALLTNRPGMEGSS